MNIRKLLIDLSKQYYCESLTCEKELSQNDDFKRGAEYARSETLKKIINHIEEVEKYE